MSKTAPTMVATDSRSRKDSHILDLSLNKVILLSSDFSLSSSRDCSMTTLFCSA